MKTTYNLQIRAFMVTVRDERTGEEHGDIIVLDKPRLQAAQLVGQSSKELIERIYHKQGFKVLAVGKADKMAVQFQLDRVYDDLMIRKEIGTQQEAVKEVTA